MNAQSLSKNRSTHNEVMSDSSSISEKNCFNSFYSIDFRSLKSYLSKDLTKQVECFLDEYSVHNFHFAENV